MPNCTNELHTPCQNPWLLANKDLVDSSHGLIQCGTFSLGGFQWAIFLSNSVHGRISYASFYLKLLSEATQVVVVLSFSLVNESGKTSQNSTKSETFTYSKKGELKGFQYFGVRSDIDRSIYVKDGNLMIQCNLNIIKPSVQNCLPVPPSNLQQHLNHLLQSGVGADVSFKVKSEIFQANRGILAARSSVFRAELFGSMRESKGGCIEIEDMEPKVFKALLRFIYTDALCLSDGCDDQDEVILAQHLIVASDRYDLERLKLICEDNIARRICKDNVMTTLMLAARHNCENLGKICLDYLSSCENPGEMLKQISLSI